MIKKLLLSFLVCLSIYADPIEHVTVAILAKDKEHTLPLYLSCIENQTWPKEKTYLYIRTNNNTDNTQKILQEWVKKVEKLYAGVYFDPSDVPENIQQYKQHEWNPSRFKVLGKIRQDSLNWAKEHNSHYFVADCDNLIQPHTLERVLQTHLPIVAPLLRREDNHRYANFHGAVDANGYYIDVPSYDTILARQVRGFIEVPVVHCTYLIRHEVLDQMAYQDETPRHEYVIFSDNARKKGIPQYLDNRELYGRISFAEDKEAFAKEDWMPEFLSPGDGMKNAFTRIYENGVWARNAEGRGSSGEGSTAQNTLLYRMFLQSFLEANQIKSVVDAGCGDWEFSRLINWKGIKYTGYDIVSHVIETNKRIFQTPDIQFVNEDFSGTELAAADLFICKDVLQHLPNEVILSILPKLKKYKYCLLINDIAPQAENSENALAGGYRRLDLTKPPFNLSGERVFVFDCGLVKKEIFLIKNP